MISPELKQQFQMIYPVQVPEDVYRIQKNELPLYISCMNVLDAQHILGLSELPETEEQILAAFKVCHTELLDQEKKLYELSVKAGIFALKDEYANVSSVCSSPELAERVAAATAQRPSYMEDPHEVFLLARAQAEYISLVEWAKISAARARLTADLRERLKAAGLMTGCAQEPQVTTDKNNDTPSTPCP